MCQHTIGPRQLTTTLVAVLFATTLLVTLYSIPTYSIANEPQSVVESIRQAIKASVSPEELRLMQTVYSDIDFSNDSDNADEQHNLARSLLEDRFFEEHDELQIITSVFTLLGTRDDVNVDGEFDVIQLPQMPRSDNSVIVVVRMPRQRDVPTATLLTVIERTRGQHRSTFTAKKTFEYQKNKWMLLTSKSETLGTTQE